MLLHQVIHEDAPSPRKLNGQIPRDLETICLKCLHKEPKQRYDSAKELAEELRRYLAGSPIVARPISVWQRIWRGYQQHVEFFAASYTIFTFFLIGLMPIMMLFLSLFVALPSPTDLLNTIAISTFSLIWAWIGVRSGVSAFQGNRRGQWVCLLLFASFCLVALWGMYWSLSTLSQTVGLDQLYHANPFNHHTGGFDPLIRNSVIGYAMLGLLWAFLGFALQFHAVRRSSYSSSDSN